MVQSAQDRIVWKHVRAHDRDRYLSTLFAPRGARDALMALYAFSLDVSRIPEAVSEPMLGEIRLQWWRDALETLEQGGKTGNPVADGLGEAMRECNLPKPLLLGVIDARAFDLSGEPMPDMPALSAYLQKTSGNIFALAAQILGNKMTPELEKDAARAGFVWGLIRHLRLLPAHASTGRLYLPASHFGEHGADIQAMFRGEADENVRDALADLRSLARSAFAGVRESVPASPHDARIAFLPLAPVPSYLRSLEALKDAPLSRVAEIGPLTRLLRLSRAAIRKKV